MKIIIIEDETRLAQYLKRALEEEGYTVEHLSNGKEAITFIEYFHANIDAIILDILLPGISGLQICRNLRKKHISVPILMLTAKDQEKEKIEGLDAGADDYLTKPFSLKELLARIRSITRRATGQMNSIYLMDNLKIDVKKRAVYQSKKEVELTLKEYELLELFITHPNHAFHRQEILETVWGVNYDTFSNVVDVHIGSLRKKIKDNKHPYLIQSVRGIGYRLNTLTKTS